VVYDLFGDGRSKVFGFVGRYYDPIRNDMTSFAGNTTGAVNQEQICVGNQWLGFRTRGGGVTLDSVFGPSTKTPYTDEAVLGFTTTFGSDVGLSVTGTNRKTRDIFEDYDLAVYSDPNGDTTTGNANAASPFFLPVSYFGYNTDYAGRPQNVNFVLGALAGAKRDYWGYEIALTKYKIDNWMGQISYTWNDAKGNTNSDGNADYQGDVIYLDPRAPHAYGPQAGNIEHLLKAYGSYEFDFGLEVSTVFNWNSGSLYTPAVLTGARYFPSQVPAAYEYGGVTANWLQPGQVGSEKNPAYYTFDLRFKYIWELPFGETEFFLDISNVFDKQSPITEMPLLAGSGQFAFGQPNTWVSSRRAYLGARYSF
jgi:hypothetical protein